MKNLIVVLAIAMFFSACELIGVDEEGNNITSLAQPEVDSVYLDQFEFTISWPRVHDAESYDINYRVYHPFRPNSEHSSGGGTAIYNDEISGDNVIFTLDLEQEKACGALVEIDVMASAYSDALDDYVTSNASTIQVEVPECEVEITVLDQMIIDEMCDGDSIYIDYVYVGFKNLTYNLPANMWPYHGTSVNLANMYQASTPVAVESGFQSTKIVASNIRYFPGPGRFENLIRFSNRNVCSTTGNKITVTTDFTHYLTGDKQTLVYTIN